MNILVCLDLSDSTDKIISQVEVIVRKSAAKLWLLHVTEPEPDFIGYKGDPKAVRDFLEDAFQQEHEQICNIEKDLKNKGLEAASLFIQGPTVESIFKEAKAIEADMIVVGSHGRGAMYQLLVGSISEEVLHKAEIPVLVIPTHERD